MATELQLGGVSVDVKFKNIGNVHLSVYPPTGRVTISAPEHMSLEAIRLFAISKISWIRRQQGRFLGQDRESPREYLDRESHYLWGKRYLLHLVEADGPVQIELSHRTIEMSVPPGTPVAARKDLLDKLYRRELRQRAAGRITFIERRLGVSVNRFFVQRLKTKWGSSTPSRRTIRLNLELAKFDSECLDYILFHEIAHFIAPTHDSGFIALLDHHMPNWGIVRARLNRGPLVEI